MFLFQSHTHYVQPYDMIDKHADDNKTKRNERRV